MTVNYPKTMDVRYVTGSMKKIYKDAKTITETMILAEASNMSKKERGELFVKKVKQLRKNK